MAKKLSNNSFNARAFMEIAIDEMMKSKNEPRPDGKIPPRVGAVIVYPDSRTYETAFRGELRDGDHAEFTLLERKLSKEQLDECILFTTLEPCVERNAPKVPCCRRTTNARIKKVYVGIVDPDPTVSRKGILHLENHGAKVLMFDRDLQKQIEEANKDFLKQALERKRIAEQEDVVTLPFEQIVPTANLDVFSEKALQKFVTESNLNFEINSLDFFNFLSDLGALSLDKNSNQLKPTGVGILLFGKNPRLLFKQASLKCTADFGNNQIETSDFNEPLVLIPDLVQNWIKKILPQLKDTSNFKRQENSIFPMDVLREAVINAIVHRDYSIEGAKSYFQITDEAIIVKSPGAPLPEITIEQLNTFKAPSISRNPIITYVFNLMGYVEETGFGMASLKRLHDDYGFPLPEYQFISPFLQLTFPRTLEAVKNVHSNKNITQLTNRQLQGYEWIKNKVEASTREYSAHFNIGYKTAQRDLSRMRELALINDNGEDVNSPNYKYSVLE
jgi:ATP-dependent DNA helicase RecG